jgi:hypothetical protein
MARFFSASAFRAPRSAPAQRVEQKGVRDTGAWPPGPHRANSDLRSGELCGRRQPSPFRLWNRCMHSTLSDEEFMNSPPVAQAPRTSTAATATDKVESFPSGACPGVSECPRPVDTLAHGSEGAGEGDPRMSASARKCHDPLAHWPFGPLSPDHPADGRGGRGRSQVGSPQPTPTNESCRRSARGYSLAWPHAR